MNTLDPQTGEMAIRSLKRTTRFDKLDLDSHQWQKPSTITFLPHTSPDGRHIVIRQIWYPGDHIASQTLAFYVGGERR